MAENGFLQIARSIDGRHHGGSPAGNFVAPPPNYVGMGIGTNLTPPTYYETIWPFNNLMYNSDGWRSVAGAGVYNIDNQDRITQLEGDRVLEKYVIVNSGHPNIPEAGEYTFRKGAGDTCEYRIANATDWLSEQETTFTLTPGQGLILQVRGGTLTECKILVPGVTHAQDIVNPWRREYLEYLKGFNYKWFRFLDFINTNVNYGSKWEERTRPGALSFSGYRYRLGGLNVGDGSGMRCCHVPYELMIDLCNRLNVMPWFTIPIFADDDYIQQLAVLIEDQLSPRLKFYIEYGNETWNWTFRNAVVWSGLQNIQKHTLEGRPGSAVVTFQDSVPAEGETIRVFMHPDSEARPVWPDPLYSYPEVAVVNVSGNSGTLQIDGQDVTLAENVNLLLWHRTSDHSGVLSSEDIDYGTAKRSREIWQIFETTLANSQNLVRVIASQVSWLARSQNRIGPNGTNGTHDVLSVAPYFHANGVWSPGTTVNELTEALRLTDDPGDTALTLNESYRMVDDLIALGEKELIFYEWGQHFTQAETGRTDAAELSEASQTFRDLNASQEMGDIYNDCLIELAKRPEVQGVVVFKGDYGRWGQYGYWCLKTSADAEDTPKLIAVRDFQGDVPRQDSRDTGGQALSERDSFREYIFGHSLSYWGDPNTPANEQTSIIYMMSEFARADSKPYSATGHWLQTYAFEPPATGIWRFTNTDNPMDSGSFAEANFDSFTLMPSNFQFNDTPDSPWVDPFKVIDYATAQQPGISCFLYYPPNQPQPRGITDMSAAEFQAFRDVARSSWLIWCNNFQNYIVTQRPDLNLRTIPVAQVLADVQELFPDMGFRDWYYDDGPHMLITTFVVAAMIYYRVTIGKSSPTNITLPDSVHENIRNNLSLINQTIEQRLEFYNNNGVNVY